MTQPFDLTDASLLFRDDVIADPLPLYGALREHAPVWEIPGTRAFMVTTMALVDEAVARTDDFSSNLNGLLYQGDDGCPVTFDMTAFGDATHVLATADPPVHTGHRRLLRPALTPRHVATLEADVRAMVDKLLDPLLDAGHGDAMTGLADPLPARVISRLIGLPAEDEPLLIRLVRASDQILAGVVDASEMAAAATAAAESETYLSAQLQRALTHKADEGSMLALLAEAVHAQEMPFGEAVGILVQLIGAGVSTTTGFLGSAIRSLAANPHLQQQLRDDPAAIPPFLEETLRVAGPFQFHYRTTTRPTTLGGVDIPAGAPVLLMWAAANLDTSVFPAADRIDLHRESGKPHIAFGRGIHFCIGAPLARLEGRLTIEQLLLRTESFTLDPTATPLTRPNIFMRQLAMLPIITNQTATTLD
jgi:cytochrome P450